MSRPTTRSSCPLSGLSILQSGQSGLKVQNPGLGSTSRDMSGSAGPLYGCGAAQAAWDEPRSTSLHYEDGGTRSTNWAAPTAQILHTCGRTLQPHPAALVTS